MEQIVWTAIGLLAATLFGNFWYLGTKIDSVNNRSHNLAARLDGRIDALASQLQVHLERHASSPDLAGHPAMGATPQSSCTSAWYEALPLWGNQRVLPARGLRNSVK